MADELREEARTWFEENWDPDLTVAEWWERLGTSGWAVPYDEAVRPSLSFARTLAPRSSSMRTAVASPTHEAANSGVLPR